MTREDEDILQTVARLRQQIRGQCRRDLPTAKAVDFAEALLQLVEDIIKEIGTEEKQPRSG